MKKRVLVTMFILIVAVAIPQLTFSADKKISPREATKLILQQFGEIYWPMFIGTRTYELSRQADLKQMEEIVKKFERTGFVKYTITQTPPGPRHQLTTELTEKAKKKGYIPWVKGPQVVAFLFGTTTVERIVDITQDNTVLFIYKFHPSEDVFIYDPVRFQKGKEYRYRGKLMLKYDPFLERYITKGFQWSEMENEQWQDAVWTDTRGGKRVHITGIEK